MSHKVGVFSGTFDPVHEGHLSFARQALSVAGLDKLFFLVEPRPRRKQGVKAFEHRLGMVQLAIANEPAFGAIVLEQDRFTPTDTLPVLKARFKGAELVMLMGDDLLLHLAEWPQVETLLKAVTFVIGVRQGSLADIQARLKTIEAVKGAKLSYQLFASQLASVSSSQVRQELRRGQRPTGLPGAVWEYIQANRLYSAGSSSKE